MGIDAQMFVKTRTSIGPEAVRSLSVDLVEAFGTDILFVIRPDAHRPEGRHALEIVTEYEQDGDPVYPEEGETLIEVHIWGRYYGESYERGYPWEVVAVAEWLERRIPGCEVWYGGDSSGICAAPFGFKERDRLMGHFAAVGHKPYREHFDPMRSEGVPYCDFCRVHMTQYGFGGDYAAWSCHGCGHRLERRAGVIKEPSRECPRCLTNLDKK